MVGSGHSRFGARNGFHPGDPENIRALYRRHARGSSLYRNLGNGTFSQCQRESRSRARPLGLVRRRLGFRSRRLSGPVHRQWLHFRARLDARRQWGYFQFFLAAGGGQIPAEFLPSANYELGWNAINELIRSDATWNGYERNVFYANNRDGTLSEVSGVTGLDFPDDSRAFVLADLDRDGRLEIVLKNRNAPQLRILRNVMKEIGRAVAFRLSGTRSNRDAVGAAVTVESGGHRQTKFLQAGSGFLSQHSKELFFGLGNAQGTIRATVRWPSGLTQTFGGLPVNRRIALQEGTQDFAATPFSPPSASYARTSKPSASELLPAHSETWLIEPLRAPDFPSRIAAGKVTGLGSLPSSSVLLHFWARPLRRRWRRTVAAL